MKMILGWKGWRWKKAWLIGIALAVVFFVFASSNFIYVVQVRNGGLSGAMYPLQEESWDHPRLKKLAFDERLYEVLSTGATENEKVVLLRKWVHSQWQGKSEKFYYPPWDASEILRLAREHGNRAFCAQYAIVFLQACLSVGIPARYVDLPGHFVVEVWSNEFNKWILMDPTSDLHYRKRGMPIDGIDLCEAYWTGTWKDLVKVHSNWTTEPVTSKEEIAPYRDYSILVYNNQLSRPIEFEINHAPAVLTLQNDYKKYPFIGRDELGFHSEILAWQQEGQTEFDQSKKRSNDIDDFRYPMNQTLIDVAAERPTKAQVLLKFRSVNASSFESFMVMADDNGIWREAQANIVYPLEPGFNKISCRIKNRFGRLGPKAWIQVFYKPSWFKLSNPS